jgi:hypothetical protein
MRVHDKKDDDKDGAMDGTRTGDTRDGDGREMSGFAGMHQPEIPSKRRQEAAATDVHNFSDLSARRFHRYITALH